MNTMPLEEDTRALINNTLANLGWKWNGIDQNIYFERTKTKEEQQKLKGKRPDYVLYPKKGDKPLIVIEAKRKGAKIDAALEQGIEYAKAISAPLVFATDGVFCKSFHTIDNCTPILNGEELDEFVRETLAIQFLKKHEVNTVSPKVQYDRKELIKIFDEANNMLRGEGLRAGIERFGEFANILFLKLVSETEQIKIESGEKSRFDYFCHWDMIKEIPSSARIEYINNTVYKRLNNLYNTEIFTPLCIRNKNILSKIIDRLDPLMLTDVDSDIKGDAFEYFLRASTATKNDLGEYFTPRHIVKTMVRLLNPKIGEKIYDPFCGTGGFLIETFRYIYNNMARTEQNLDVLKNKTIYGNEITNTARITKMNMILAGDGHSNIEMRDSLANPIDGNKSHNGFDVVITNMPYSQKTQYGNLYDIPSTNGDSVCVQHCMKSINNMAENGRMALVVPEGFLFRKDLARTREYLLEHCQLQSIISLPQGVFLPYTGVKTDIIYATKVNQKVKSSQKKDFWYFDVKNDGYTLDNHRRKLDTTSDLSKYEEYRKFDNEQKEDMLKVGFEIISIKEVQQNEYILVGSRYRNLRNEKIHDSKMVKLGEVSTLTRGISFPKSAQLVSYNENCLKIVTTKSAQENGIDYNNLIFIDNRYRKEEKVICAGDILISLANSLNLVGRSTYVDESDNNTSFGAFMGLIRPDKKKVNPKYLYYILRSDKAQRYFKKVARTTTNISNITFDDISNFEFPYLDIEIQNEIVNELNKYNKIIHGAHLIINNYSPEIQIQKSWNIQKLENICTFQYGYTDTALEKGDARFVRITDINVDGTLSDNNKKYINLNDKSRKYILSKNDILVARIGATYGKTLIYEKEDIAVFASYLIRLKFNSEIIPKYYFYYAQTKDYWKQAKSLVTGAGQPQFNANTIKLIKIPIPPIDEQERIINELDSETKLIAQAKNTIKTFTEKLNKKVKEIWKGEQK